MDNSFFPLYRKITIFLTLIFLCANACSQSVLANDRLIFAKYPATFTEDPISFVAHGTMMGADGQPVEPDAAFIERAQRFYMADLSAKLNRKTGLRLAENRFMQIQAEISDKTLAQALYIDWLIEAANPVDRANLTNNNAALRHVYLKKYARQKFPDDAIAGISPDIWKRLRDRGIRTNEATSAGGAAYIKECAAAGVPVPPPIFGPGWIFRDEIEKEFISWTSVSDLWEYSSSSPAGVCLALPRSPKGSKEADLLGVICLGTETSKACFWDNPNDKTFTKGVPVDIDQFVGGFDLVANGQGVCSDCHAGENPYVIHPEMSAFSSITSNVYPGSWYQPLVAAMWPQNPGPTGVLSGVSSTGKCDSCHKQGGNGRFPDVSLALPGYCDFVLKNALDKSFPGASPNPGTMPPYGADPADYTAHINRLLQACDNYPSVGEEVPVDVKDDPNLISPPQIIEPLYACASMVSVKGAIYGAKVTLFINGTDVGSLIAHSTVQETFNVPDLVVGDVVETLQDFNGVVSAMSAKAIVKDHQVDFPAGLPAPSMDPTLIYECANNIAVRHVPGAKLTVYSNGGSPVTTGTSTDWTSVWPAIRPFTVGQSFTAEITLCKDQSPLSAAANAVAAPATLSAPAFVPPNIYPGQQLVSLQNLTNGSKTTIGEMGTGDLTSIQVPISWWPDIDIAQPLGRALQSGDQLNARQELCTKGPESETPLVGKCEELPAPKIQQPINGDTWVVVTESVPSARIHIYDANGIEIGDGSGTVITLTRAVMAGEFLTAVQQVGECTGRTGYRIQVGKNRQK